MRWSALFLIAAIPAPDMSGVDTELVHDWHVKLPRMERSG